MIFFYINFDSKSNRKFGEPVFISRNLSDQDFISGTKLQPNKAYLIIQITMNLTFGQRHRSRSKIKLSEIVETSVRLIVLKFYFSMPLCLCFVRNGSKR